MRRKHYNQAARELQAAYRGAYDREYSAWRPGQPPSAPANPSLLFDAWAEVVWDAIGRAQRQAQEDKRQDLQAICKEQEDR